jgi:hypothetical protein
MKIFANTPTTQNNYEDVKRYKNHENHLLLNKESKTKQSLKLKFGHNFYLEQSLKLKFGHNFYLEYNCCTCINVDCKYSDTVIASLVCVVGPLRKVNSDHLFT